MEVKAWFGSNVRMKGMSNLPLLWEWKYIENVLKYFFYGKLQTCQVPLIKGMILCEELSLNSRGKGTNNWYPIVILGHYSCDLILAMLLELLLF